MSWRRQASRAAAVSAAARCGFGVVRGALGAVLQRHGACAVRAHERHERRVVRGLGQGGHERGVCGHRLGAGRGLALHAPFHRLQRTRQAQQVGAFAALGGQGGHLGLQREPQFQQGQCLVGRWQCRAAQRGAPPPGGGRRRERGGRAGRLHGPGMVR